MVCFLRNLDKGVVLLPKCHSRQLSPLTLQNKPKTLAKVSTSIRLQAGKLACNKLGAFASCINVHVALMLPNCAELSRPLFALAVSGIPPKKPVYVAYVCVSRLCHSLCWFLRLSEDVSSLE